MKLIVIGLIVASLILGVTCGPAPAVEKEKAVDIGYIAGFTGVLADTTNPAGHGTIDYLTYVNEELGGIQEIKLDVRWEEGAYNVPMNITAYKRLKASGVSLIGLVMTPGTEALAPAASRDKLPLVNVATVSPLTYRVQPIYVVALFQTYADQLGTWAKWMVENWTEARPPRVGFLICDHPNGWMIVEPEPLDYLSKLGIEYLGHEVVPLAVTDASIELKRLGEKEPDWIFFDHVAGASAVIMRDAVRVGVKEKAKWAGINYALDTCLRGLAPEAIEGVHVVTMFALPDDDVPGVRLAQDIARKYNHEDRFGTDYVNGVVEATVMVEGIKLALEKVGYENYDQITGSDVRDGLMSITNLDTGGLAPPMTISEDKPFATSSFRIARAEKTKSAKWVSDWLESPDIFKAAR